MILSELQEQIRRFRDERDWMQFHNPKDMAAAIAIEAAELMQEFLWVNTDRAITRAVERQERVRDEIADIGIYLIELADNLGIDLLGAIEQKLAKNATRYPVEKCKGSSAKYDEL